jgi:hypothetical protein
MSTWSLWNRKTGIQRAVWARSLALEKQDIDTRLHQVDGCFPVSGDAQIAVS